MAIFDGHSDLFYDVTRRRLEGETRVLSTHHLERLRRGGIEGLVLAVWTSLGSGQTFWEQIPGGTDAAFRTERMAECIRAELAECPEVRLVRTARAARRARAAGQLYAFLSIEGMVAIGNHLDGIDRYAALGARMGMLTWNEENELATGAAGDPDRGLTPLGRQAIRRMEAREILLDVSHLNEGGFWEAVELAGGPVLASHSNCRALCDVSRNLTDEQLRAIRDTGGVVGLNGYHGFVHREPSKQTVEMLARHAVHMAEVMGVEHVACGFDFCEFMGQPGNEGSRGLEDAGHSENLLRWLERLGMNARERRLIARDNLLRVLE